MSDQDININSIKEKIKQFIRERDWEQYHHPKELAISLSLEAAELLELFQWKEKQSLEELKKDKDLMQKLKEELADIMIYAIDVANYIGIDVSDAILEKLKKNAEKYPVEKAKGSNKKYSEL
jgi:NTP pyrophosphatase (non-canonical NTP hydrolase)